MTEDEAFIRTIVDSPGDDLPRLVYADWLDERNDPRGTYLRAELEWAKTKQTVGFLVLRLNGLAEGLDPVWVARVSRPPVGVCCDHIWPETVGDGEPFVPVSLNDLEQLEHQLGCTLPADYRAFQLNYNGGFPDPGAFVPRPNTIGYPRDQRVNIDIFGAVHSSRRRDYVGNLHRTLSEGTIRDDGTRVTHGRMPSLLIATARAVAFYLALGRPVFGHVFAENDDWKLDGAMYQVAGSFAEFLSILTPSTAPWERMVIRGQTAAFRQWLEAVGTVLAESEGPTPLGRAIRDQRVEIVELLLERGAQPTSHEWHFAYHCKDERIREAVRRRFPQRPVDPPRSKS